MARLLVRWDRGELPSEDVGRIALALKTLMGMLTGDSTEQRLAALEAAVQELRQP